MSFLRSRLPVKLLAFVVLAMIAACGPSPEANTVVSLRDLRSSAKGSGDGEKTGRWLLDEMLAPGGTAKSAEEARNQLDKASSKGLYANLGAGLYDETHGEPKKAAAEYVQALGFAKKSEDPAA